MPKYEIIAKTMVEIQYQIELELYISQSFNLFLILNSANNKLLFIIYYLLFINLDSLKQSKIFIRQYYKFDFCQAINITFFIREIIIPTETKESIQYLLSSQAIMIANDIILKGNQIQSIKYKFKEFIIILPIQFSQFQIIILRISKIYILMNLIIYKLHKNFTKERFLDFNNTICLLDVKLIEVIIMISKFQIIDNLARISDIKLQLRIEQANVLENHNNLIKKQNNLDILIQYFYNKIAFFRQRFKRFSSFFMSLLLTKLNNNYKLNLQELAIVYHIRIN
ncbi:unnamed protein product [Paramecium pentaurelia]|uniref:Transmembrane protein n=1 Tax=Paramecium pentaurelia TaxID=43138 RepID=A0A8S1SQH1_9CILI|nr:unnamed protein product [Paramecium pentaurelia]